MSCLCPDCPSEYACPSEKEVDALRAEVAALREAWNGAHAQHLAWMGRAETAERDLAQARALLARWRAGEKSFDLADATTVFLLPNAEQRRAFLDPRRDEGPPYEDVAAPVDIVPSSLDVVVRPGRDEARRCTCAVYLDMNGGKHHPDCPARAAPTEPADD